MKTKAPSKGDMIFVFYGYSGDEGGKPAPNFETGTDHNRSFEITAKTLQYTLRTFFPNSEVQVHRAWKKSKVFDALNAAEKPIRQVHIVAHGDSTWLSLAMSYDGRRRLEKRATRINRMTNLSNDQKAYRQWAEEDAIVAGYFTHALPAKSVEDLRRKHSSDAAWQIWGCFSGFERDSFGHDDDPVLKPYFKRFALGQSEVPGIAVEIAKSLGVTCTAAYGRRGVEFWRRKGGKIVQNGKREKPIEPFWMWVGRPSKWVTYDKNGARTTTPLFFQRTWKKEAIAAGKPPAWLTDVYK